MKQVVLGSLLLFAAGWTQARGAPSESGCQIRSIPVTARANAIDALHQAGINHRQFMAWYAQAPAAEQQSLRHLQPGDTLQACVGNKQLRSLTLAGKPASDPATASAGKAFAGVQASVAAPVVVAAAPSKRPAPAAASAQTRNAARHGAVVAKQLAPPPLQTTELKTGRLLAGELEHYLSNHSLAAALSDYVRQQWQLPSRLPKGSHGILAMQASPATPGHSQLAYLQIDYRGSHHRVYHYVDTGGYQYVVGAHGDGYRVIDPMLPVLDARISSGWGWRTQPVLGGDEFHHGVDYAAPAGTPVRATMDGVVALSNWHGNYGRLIEIQHSDTVSTRYGHLRAYASNLHVGSHVQRGQIIGYVGASGLSTGPHLYYELWQHGERINPLTQHTMLVLASVPASERSKFDRYVDQQALR